MMYSVYINSPESPALVLTLHRLVVFDQMGGFMIDTVVGKGHFSVFFSSQTSLVR